MENKQTLEEVAEIFKADRVAYGWDITYEDGFIDAAKWQAETMYSEEEVLNLFKKYQYDLAQWVLKRANGIEDGLRPIPTEWFEEFKKTKDGI